MNKEELWKACLGQLEITLSKANFSTWFKNTFIIEFTDTQAIIGVPNSFTKNWLQNKYHEAIKNALIQITSKEIKDITYTIQPLPQNISVGIKKPVDAAFNRKAHNPLENKKTGLNSKYVFGHFIVGKFNELAHAAAIAISQKPGTTYNPLFIYGGVGLGKTHLLHAIGNEILKSQPDAKVLYLPCERFTNEFVQSVQGGSLESFKNTYRTVDVLLIDDIQFLAGRERTQEEFFHTFNTLHQSNRQIVLCSDHPPKALPGIEERLISRFEWGMIADVAAPDLETRIAILESKCLEKNQTIPKDVIIYIANVIQKNIRELEGALNRVIAYQELHKTVLDVDFVKKILESFTSSAKRSSITSRRLIQVVAEFYDRKIDDLTGESRKKELVRPRQIIMYLMREEINSSFPNIGNELGGRDHTTAMHAYNKISQEIEVNEKIRKDLELIKQRLYAV